MIDLVFLREHPEQVRALLQKKEPSFDVEKLISLDVRVRELNADVEALRHKKNSLADQAKTGNVSEALRQESRDLTAQLKEKEQVLAQVKQEFMDQYLCCPNLPSSELPLGGKEANKPVRFFGEQPKFSFVPKNHVVLGEALNWFDFEAAATMTGSQFALFKGDAVKLVYSLAMLMLKNNIKHGFSPVLPPFLVNERSLEIASNFPKFRDQVYEVTADNMYLTPTSEVNLTNLYRDKILKADELPIRMTAWTSCFRREAGTYGAAERGLIRIHQFDKVELYTICTPEQAEQEHERMVACAEDILKQLGLHYRVSLLAMQDCSFPSAKTYDIEVWMPGQGSYYEVSSCSNCTDFQARRGNIRYRTQSGEKTNFVYTLNASSLAFPRLIVALMETYQQEDGSINLPPVLKEFGIW